MSKQIVLCDLIDRLVADQKPREQESIHLLPWKSDGEKFLCYDRAGVLSVSGFCICGGCSGEPTCILPELDDLEEWEMEEYP